MSESLVEMFRRHGERIVMRNPELSHEWIDGKTGLRFHPLDDQGFAVCLRANEDGLTVHMMGAHEHFDLDDNPPSEVCGRAFGLLRDLLSPDMRIREKRAADEPYLWIVESKQGDDWVPECETGRILYNYLGKRTERIYTNRHLPGRMNIDESDSES